MTRVAIALACIPALLLGSATAALAQSQYESRVVYFGDLNLDAQAGADALLRRIEHAADIVCGDRPGPQLISERRSVRGCEAATTEEAVNEVGHPNLLYAYYGYMPEVVVDDDTSRDPYYEVEPRY